MVTLVAESTKPSKPPPPPSRIAPGSPTNDCPAFGGENGSQRVDASTQAERRPVEVRIDCALDRGAGINRDSTAGGRRCLRHRDAHGGGGRSAVAVGDRVAERVGTSEAKVGGVGAVSPGGAAHASVCRLGGVRHRQPITVEVGVVRQHRHRAGSPRPLEGGPLTPAGSSSYRKARPAQGQAKDRSNQDLDRRRTVKNGLSQTLACPSLACRENDACVPTARANKRQVHKRGVRIRARPLREP